MRDSVFTAQLRSASRGLTEGLAMARAAILRGPVLFTFNPERNGELSAAAGVEPRLLKIHPQEIEGPENDESVRPEGLACRIRAWMSGVQPWPMTERVTLRLTEYPDPVNAEVILPSGAEVKFPTLAGG